MAYDFRTVRDVDLEQWARLSARVAEADGHDEVYRVDDLAHELRTYDLDRDGWQVLDGDRLVAVALVLVRPGTHDGRAVALLSAAVEPADRGRGIGRELLARQEQRARDAATDRHPGRPIRLRTHAAESAASARRLLERRGYSAARWYVDLRLRFDRWQSPVPVDSGVDSRPEPYRRELDAAVRDTHGAAFADHWGSMPPDDRDWDAFYTGSPSFRPEISRLVLDEQGVAAYSLAYEFEDGDALIGQLGVRPDRQRHGLGRATLLASLVAAREAGYRTSHIAADGQNVHGAAGLYEAVGYQPHYRTAAYLRDL